MALRAAELEVLITANDKDVARADKNLKSTAQRIEGKPVTQKVTGDEKEAVESIGRVASAAKKLVSERTVATVDANIDRATKSVDRVQARLDYLRSVETDLDVSADIARAEANLSKVERQRDALVSARAKLEVIADTGSAESNVRELGSTVKAELGSAGEAGGRSLTESLDSATRGAGEAVGSAVGGDIEDTLVSALTAIPVAGGIILAAVGIGKAISGAINDGLQVEVGIDRLQALTGLDTATAIRFGNAAAESYANAFGDSIESNMDTARLAVQFDIIDEKASARDAQKVIESLGGIADALGEDVRPVAQSVTVLLRTGLVKSAEEAFDVIATGARNGMNRSEDLLDTLTEYPVLFQRLGLSGPEALGLINQGLQAGARNSDIVADGLKELQIRATDASEKSAEGYRLIGLNAEEMTAKMAAGGASARDALGVILEKLTTLEDPVARNAAGVALMGTQWEDLGDAVLALDLSTAVESLDGVNGAMQRMFDTMYTNSATKIESAKRNIEVAMRAIEGAIAAGFALPLDEVADWISNHTSEVMQFFSDIANGALDFGESVITGLAAGTDGLGAFVSGPLADFAAVMAITLGALPWPFKSDTTALMEASEQMRSFGTTASEAADTMRTDWLSGVGVVRDNMNVFLDNAIAITKMNDAAAITVQTLYEFGYASDGTMLEVSGLTDEQLRNSDAGRTLEGQIRTTLAALNDEITAARAADETQEQLTDRYNNTTNALVDQMMQMGLTEEQARALIKTVLETPESATTEYSSNAQEEQGRVQNLADRIDTLPNGSVVILADTGPAVTKMDQMIRDYSGRVIPMYVDANGRPVNAGMYASGAVVEFMAGGGVRGASMQSLAQMVPPNTWRVVGDRGDVPEAFIPLDGSPRSWALLNETYRRRPGAVPMAEGGVLGGGGSTGGWSPTQLADAIARRLAPLILRANGAEAARRGFYGGKGLL